MHRTHYEEDYPISAHLSVNETFYRVTQSDAQYFTRVSLILHGDAADQCVYNDGGC